MASRRLEQFGRLMRESPIKAIVGKGSTNYYIHPRVLARPGSAFQARVDGSWKDSGDPTIDWTEFDCETIDCVLSYLYTGDYSPQNLTIDIDSLVKANCIENHEEDIQGELEIQQHEDGLSRAETVSENALEPADMESLLEQACLQDDIVIQRPLTPLSLCSGVRLPAEFSRTAAGILAEMELEDRRVSAGVDILTHAKVYSFARCFMLDELVEFALERLKHCLNLADCGSTYFMPYLTDTVRIIYEATGDRKTRNEPARELLSHFVALNFRDLLGPDFEALAFNGGDFMVDVTYKLGRKLGAQENKARIINDKARVMSKELGIWQEWNRGVNMKYRRIVPDFAVEPEFESDS